MGSSKLNTCKSDSNDVQLERCHVDTTFLRDSFDSSTQTWPFFFTFATKNFRIGVKIS